MPGTVSTRASSEYFSHAEVFRRIAEVESRDRMRLCVERDEQTGESRLLAASNPTRAILRYDDLMETLDSYEGENVRYGDGVVESTHVPRIGGNAFRHWWRHVVQSLCRVGSR